MAAARVTLAVEMKLMLNRRRFAAGLFLGLAAALLLVGELFLRQRLSPLGLLFYWGGCLFATFAAILCALLDLGRSLRQSHDAQRELLEETVREIIAGRERRESTEHAGRKSR